MNRKMICKIFGKVMAYFGFIVGVVAIHCEILAGLIPAIFLIIVGCLLHEVNEGD